MPDIEMCMNDECTEKFHCYRWMAEPSKVWQSYIKFGKDRDELDFCLSFWPIEDHHKVKEVELHVNSESLDTDIYPSLS